MNKNFSKMILLGAFLLSSLNILHSQQLAFPTAEGFGKHTVGGRGGKVIEVTNLNDSGIGSLRAAVNASGKRTVVFRVSGTINLKSALEISQPYITIAGQTAPGDGICLKGYKISIRTSQIIIRYIRVRYGDIAGIKEDAISSRYNENIILDHVTASWSIDETVSLYHNDKITIQWCMITESLFKPYTDLDNHGFGGIWGGPNASFHHNLIAHHSSRNPRFASGCGYTDYRNNVIYNWGYQSAYGGEGHQEGNASYNFSSINMVANYYKPGPGTGGGSLRYRIVAPSSREGSADYGSFYVADNYVYGNAKVTADNWDGGVQGGCNKLDEPATYDTIEQHTAVVAYQLVLNHAGASLPRRDSLDNRIIQEVTEGTATYGTSTYNQRFGYGSTPTGIIDSQDEVGGWPTLNNGSAPIDTDHDGMPDDWEIENGLNKDDASDRNGIGEGGYTNLEIYLNSIIEYPPLHACPSKSCCKIDWYHQSRTKLGRYYRG